MARNPLAVLDRLRDAAVTQASRDLAVARDRAGQEARHLQDHQLHVRREQTEVAGGDVAAFAAWLPHARQGTARLQDALRTEEARVQRMQEILTIRRTDARAVAKALERQRDQAGLLLTRKDQAVMDEAAGRQGARKTSGQHGIG